MSGIAAPGFIRATVGPSSGRRCPLLVTMSASSSGAASLLVEQLDPVADARRGGEILASTRAPPPPFRSGCRPATAWTSRAPASAASTGVTP